MVLRVSGWFPFVVNQPFLFMIVIRIEEAKK